MSSLRTVSVQEIVTMTTQLKQLDRSLFFISLMYSRENTIRLFSANIQGNKDYFFLCIYLIFNYEKLHQSEKCPLYCSWGGRSMSQYTYHDTKLVSTGSLCLISRDIRFKLHRQIQHFNDYHNLSTCINDILSDIYQT